jgi:hypothetical protein
LLEVSLEVILGLLQVFIIKNVKREQKSNLFALSLKI